MFRWELRTFGERGVKNRRVGPRNEQAGRIAGMVALNFATGRIGRVLRVPARAQGGLIQQRATIQMENKDRSVRRDGIDLIERRHSSLGELKFAPAANYAHPLAGWRALRLFLEHSQSVRERWHTIPTEF